MVGEYAVELAMQLPSVQRRALVRRAERREQHGTQPPQLHRFGGAAHFAAVVRAIRREAPLVTIEILTPDFLRKPTFAAETVIDSVWEPSFSSKCKMGAVPESTPMDSSSLAKEVAEAVTRYSPSGTASK